MHATLAVAGLSARLLASAAAEEGFDVVATDLFGDADTRALARQWWPLGEVGRLQVDGACLHAALQAAASAGATGWIAGSGFEDRQDLLQPGAQPLPLIGCDMAAVAPLRDPQVFFPFLAEHGIPCPQVSRQRPDDGQAWLIKDLHACGASHIRLLSATAKMPVLRPGQFLQRRAPGHPMSATFVANGCRARLIGINRQTIRAHPTRADLPYVFCGVVGPVPLADHLLQSLQQALDVIVAGFGPHGLKGLGSLDFLLQADSWLVLEVNPRPPASLALYPQHGLMAAHVQACRYGVLPEAPPPPTAVQGYEIVFARRALQLKPAHAAWLAAQPDVHDLPAANQCFAIGDPLCSITSSAGGAADVLARLSARRDALLTHLETST